MNSAPKPRPMIATLTWPFFISSLLRRTYPERSARKARRAGMISCPSPRGNIFSIAPAQAMSYCAAGVRFLARAKQGERATRAAESITRPELKKLRACAECPLMRLGINTFLFTSPFTNDSTKLFPMFKKWGFETVEIPVEDPSHIDPKYVQAELEKNGLVCGSVCACMGPDRDLRGTPEAQETGKKYLLALIDQAVDLGHAKMIGPVYSAVGRADSVEPAEYTKPWQTCVKQLKEIC